MANKYISTDYFVEKLDEMLASAESANFREALKEWGKTVSIEAIPLEPYGRDVAAGDRDMTLDEAIAHLDESLSDSGRWEGRETCRCEHEALLAWLVELRERRKGDRGEISREETES